MCGIAGLVKPSGLPNTAVADVRVMLEAQRHRGPDHAGIWHSAGMRCVLGHNRLSSIDLSEQGNQPMISAATGNVISYNGEIFNYQALRKTLTDTGRTFQSETDTEVILALYDRYGTSCLRFLRGMFSFAIWDEGLQRLFFARDRLGEKPFVYSCANGRLAFASEIAALAGYSQLDLSEDREAMNYYLQLQYIPAPYTIFRQIRKLPPAHFGIFDKNGLKIHRYWELHYSETLQGTDQELLEQLHEKIDESVKIRLIGDQEVGATLSGGVDSSLVTALAAEHSSYQVKSFTVAVDDRQFDESAYAEAVAKQVGTDHHVRLMNDDIEDLLRIAARIYGEPFADKGCIQHWRFRRLQRHRFG